MIVIVKKQVEPSSPLLCGSAYRCVDDHENDKEQKAVETAQDRGAAVLGVILRS